MLLTELEWTVGDKSPELPDSNTRMTKAIAANRLGFVGADRGDDQDSSPDLIRGGAI